MAMRPGPYEHLHNRRDLCGARPASPRSQHSGASTRRRLPSPWLLAQPQVTAVVVGPSASDQLEPALTALEHRLSQSEAEELAALFG